MEVPVIVEFLDEDGWLVRMPSALEPCLFERDGRIILRIQEDCLGPNEFYIKGFLYSAEKRQAGGGESFRRPAGEFRRRRPAGRFRRAERPPL